MPAFPGRSLCSPGRQLADESSVLVSASVLFTLSSRPVSLLIFSYGNEPQQPSVGEVVSLPSSALMQGTRVQEAAPASPPCGTRSHVSLGSHHHAAVRAAPRAPPQGIRAAGSPVLLHILLMYFSHVHALPSSFCGCLAGTTPPRHLILTLL